MTGIASHQQHEIRPVDVGNRDAPHVAIHQLAGDILGLLIDGGRAIDSAHLQLLEEITDVAHQIEALRDHVAGVGRQRLAAILLDDRVSDSLAMTQRLRSEEHTSELQSLMRTSYAVFCLKKKSKIRKT